MKRTLEAIVETMLPGGSGFPGAIDTDVVAWLENQQRFLQSLEKLVDALPTEFADAKAAERVSMLEAVEARLPSIFDAATVAIYSAYYTRPEVLAAIEVARGYKAVPPQPGGYDLAAFDPAILSVPSSREKQWRDPDQGGSS